jgi:hypothetical protein
VCGRFAGAGAAFAAGISVEYGIAHAALRRDEKNEFSGFMLGRSLRGGFFQSECVESEGQNEEVLNDLTEAWARLSEGFRPRG